MNITCPSNTKCCHPTQMLNVISPTNVKHCHPLMLLPLKCHPLRCCCCSNVAPLKHCPPQILLPLSNIVTVQMSPPLNVAAPLKCCCPSQILLPHQTLLPLLLRSQDLKVQRVWVVVLASVKCLLEVAGLIDAQGTDTLSACDM